MQVPGAIPAWLKGSSSPPVDEVRRTGLLERLAAASPRVVSLTAPAGFGKSTLARQYAQPRGRYAVCDCASVRSGADFVRALCLGLASLRADLAERYSVAQTVLDDVDDRERRRLTFDIAEHLYGEGSVIFENAEGLAGEAAELLAAALQGVAPRVCAIIASRKPLRLNLGRSIPPHEVVNLRAPDLAFDADEVRATIPPASADRVDEVMAITQGWPIAVLLLARIAREGLLGEQTTGAVLENVDEYLVREYLDSLPVPALDALVRCALVPETSVDELPVGPDAAFTVISKANTYVVHPLLREVIHERFSNRRDELIADAQRSALRDGAHVRAARFALLNGDHLAAAQALARADFGAKVPPLEFFHALSATDPAAVRAHPVLWYCSLEWRSRTMAPSTQAEEARALHDALPPELDVSTRVPVALGVVIPLIESARAAEALAAVENLAEQIGLPQSPRDVIDAHLRAMRAKFDARAGNLERWSEAAAAVASFEAESDSLRWFIALDRARYVLAPLGRFDEARDELAAALQQASGGVLGWQLSVLEGAVFLAWLAGDDETVALRAAQMEGLVEQHLFQRYRFLAKTAVGHKGTQPCGFETMQSLIFAHLIACGQARDRAEARACAHRAAKIADEYGVPFYSVLARVALAELGARDRAGEYRRACSFAGGIAAPPLHAALAALARGTFHGHVLAPFVRRLHRVGSAAAHPSAPALRVEIFRARVLSRGLEVHLADRELQLAIALASHRHARQVDAVIDLLWGHMLDPAAARNAFKASLHRLRDAVGLPGAIVVSHGTVHLAREATVDLWEIEDQLGPLCAKRSLGGEDLRVLRNAIASVEALRASTAILGAWEWFAPTQRRIVELAAQAAVILGEALLARSQIGEALELAGLLRGLDECDEYACSLAMRAHLASEDRPAAEREYRRHRDLLAREFSIEPSAEIESILPAAQESAEKGNGGANPHKIRHSSRAPVAQTG